MKDLSKGGKMDKEFVKYYNLYKDDVLKLAISYTKRISDAEDILQNVFIKLYKNIDRIEESKVKKWCIKVTINECRDFFNSFWIKNIFVRDELLFNITDSKETNLLKDELFKLSTKYRITIYLYYYEGYKINEIAGLLKKNPSTIQTWLTRGKQKLKNYLKEDTNEK